MAAEEEVEVVDDADVDAEVAFDSGVASALSESIVVIFVALKTLDFEDSGPASFRSRRGAESVLLGDANADGGSGGGGNMEATLTLCRFWRWRRSSLLLLFAKGVTAAAGRQMDVRASDIAIGTRSTRTREKRSREKARLLLAPRIY